MLDKQFIFIIGSPRSGTTWMQIMLNAHPSVCTSVELTLFDKYIASWIKIWSKEKTNIERERWKRGLPFLWSEREFSDFLSYFLEKAYEKVIVENPQATHILDKNPNYAFSHDLINMFLPNARFIHMLRDGRDVVSSMLAARRDIGFGPSSVEEATSLWMKSVIEAQKGEQYEDRYLEVRYEDLLARNSDKLRSIFNFCGLSVSFDDAAKIIEATSFDKMKARRATPVEGIDGIEEHYRKGIEGSWREDLTSRQKFIVNKIAGDLLNELGYASDDWWTESRLQSITMPVLVTLTTNKHFAKVVKWRKIMSAIFKKRTKLFEKRVKLLANSIGARYRCNVCNSPVRTFQPLPKWISDNIEKYGWPYEADQAETCNYKNYRCPFCEANDRDRLYALYIRNHLAMTNSNKEFKILDFGPHKPLSRFIDDLIRSTGHNATYRTADLHSKDVDDRVDITSMGIYADEQFDFFICSHVLEHVVDDRKALRELYRILKHGCQGIIMVPIVLGLEEIDEDPSVVDEVERWRRFGQNDHVRLYSKEGFLRRVEEADFIVHQYGEDYFGKANFDRYGITSQSVLYVVEK